jgi:hypothetical protein
MDENTPLRAIVIPIFPEVKEKAYGRSLINSLEFKLKTCVKNIKVPLHML